MRKRTTHSCANERSNLRLVIKGVYYYLGKPTAAPLPLEEIESKDFGN